MKERPYLLDKRDSDEEAMTPLLEEDITPCLPTYDSSLIPAKCDSQSSQLQKFRIASTVVNVVLVLVPLVYNGLIYTFMYAT